MSRICKRAAIILTGLWVFGVLYDRLVGRLERRGYDRGYTAFLVVGGTAVTLLGATALVGWKNVLRTLGCFAASGLPMVVGSVARHVLERERDQATALAVARERLTCEKRGGNYAGMPCGSTPTRRSARMDWYGGRCGG